MHDRVNEFYHAAMEAEEKHTYFLLGASGACIAFALTQTTELQLNWEQLTVGLAVLLWASSVAAGCIGVLTAIGMRRTFITFIRQLRTEDLVETQGSEDSDRPSHKTASDIEKRGEKIAICYFLQFILLGAGVIFYIFWHLYRMSLNT